MNINEMFPGNFLKAADFPAARTLTIKAVAIEEIGDEKARKPVLFFFEEQRGLVLNKTNANMLAHYYGPNTDAWLNRPTELFAEPVSFQGQIVSAIRVRMPQPPVMQQPAPVPQPAQSAPPIAAPVLVAALPSAAPVQQQPPVIEAQQPVTEQQPAPAVQPAPAFNDLDADLNY